MLGDGKYSDWRSGLIDVNQLAMPSHELMRLEMYVRAMLVEVRGPIIKIGEIAAFVEFA